MNAPQPSTGPAEDQSNLAEVVEQTADAARLWCDEIVELSKHKADLIASGDYGLRDVITGQVGLLRIGVRNGVLSAFALVDNLALLAARPHTNPGTVRTRQIKVRVRVPANHRGNLTSSELVGRLENATVPGSSVQLAPAQVAAQVNDQNVTVTVVVTFDGVPNDLYSGCISSPDKAVSAPFMVALREVGT